ncbi:restriction endonuclease subunit R, partial [candidate division KSB1 bacterium]
SDEDTFLSLAGRLSRFDKQISSDERKRFIELAGKDVKTVVHELFEAFDPDKIEQHAREINNVPDSRAPDNEEYEQAQKNLARKAAATFHGELNTYIDQVRRVHEQLIDVVNIDRVTFAGWDAQAKEQIKNLVQDFDTFLREHQDEIVALKIYYAQPWRRREVTFRMMNEVVDLIKRNKPNLMPLHVWQAYAQLEGADGKPTSQLTALVSLIRRMTGLDSQLTVYSSTVNVNFQEWVFAKQAGALKFNSEQMEWLRLIKDHIAASVHMQRDDLEYAPFDARGGIGRMYQLFGEDMDGILDEMNEALAA